MIGRHEKLREKPQVAAHPAHANPRISLASSAIHNLSVSSFSENN
jgi:hypothetical protein